MGKRTGENRALSTRRRWGRALCVGLVTVLLSLPIGAADCIDDFDPDPLGAGNYADVVETDDCAGGSGLKYTFTSDGGGPYGPGQGFEIVSGQLRAKAGDEDDGTTERITIESRDGKAFVFTEMFIEMDSGTYGSGFTIEGIGPEPFSESGPAPGSSATVGPAEPKLVTLIEITSVDFFADGIDDLVYGSGVPGAAIYGNGKLIVNEDTTPSTSDDTDMGTTTVGGTIDKTFTISSIGAIALDLTGSPYVTVSNTTDFSVQAQPTTDPIAAGSSDTFTIRFSPASSGVKTATVTITNNSEANPYTFDIEGEGSGAPEIDVEGNGTSIPDGDTSPELADHTHFGDVEVGSSFDRTFTIQNEGNAPLTLTNHPSAVQLSSNPSGDFSVHTQPSTGSIAASSSTTFVVRCTPDGTGDRIATVSIANNDAGEDPYDFQIKCTGVDTDPPGITSILRQSPSGEYTNADTVTFRVTFDEDVVNVGTTDFTLSGAASGTVNAVTTTTADTVFDVDVTGISGDGELDLDVAGGNDIEDASGNPLGASPTIGSEETYTIDNTAPTDPTPSSSSHTVSTWDDDPTIDVEWSGASDETTSVAGYSISWDTNPTGVPDTTQDVAHTADPHTATSPSLVDGNSHYFHIRTQDAVGNWTSTEHLGPFFIDTTSPSIPSGLGPADGAHTNDTSPTLSWDASTDAGGSGLRDTGTYRVQVTDDPTTWPLIKDYYTENTSYTPTLYEDEFTWRVYSRDNAGNSSAWSAEFTLTIDTTAPELVSFERKTPAGEHTNADTLVFLATFDEDVQGVDPGDFVENGTSGATIAVSQVTASTYDVTLSGGTLASHNGVVGIDLAGSPTITDLAGNALPAGDPTTDETYTVDNDSPAVNSVTASPSTIADATAGAGTFTVTTVFDEAMDTNTSADVLLAPDVASGGTATLSNGTGSWSSTTHTNDTYTVTYDVADQNVDIDSVTVDVTGAQDLSGNGQGDYTPVHEFDIDTLNPWMSSITSTTPNGYYGVGAAIDITMNFSENVTMTGPPEVDLDSGASGVPLGIPSGSASTNGTYTVGAGENSSDLNVDSVTIPGIPTDAAGNGMDWTKSNATLNTDNLADYKDIVVDTTGPTVSGVSVSDTLISDADTGAGKTFTVTVAFSEDMTTDGSADPSLTFDPAVGTTLSGASGSWGGTTDTYTVTYSTVSDAGVDEDSVTIDVTGAKDAADNDQADYTPVHEFAIDTENPTVISFWQNDTLLTDADVGAAMFEWVAVFSESMSGPRLGASYWVYDYSLTWNSEAWSSTNVNRDTFTHRNNVHDENATWLDRDIRLYNDTSRPTTHCVYDSAGNSLVEYWIYDAFTIDTENPTVTSVSISDALISDADTGAGKTFTVTVEFSEAMTTDGSADPTLTFAPAGGSTLGGASGSWGGTTDTYTVTYSTVSDAGVDEDSVTIDVTGAKDANGNDQADYTPEHEFEIDTVNPTADIAVSDTLISDADTGAGKTFTVTVEFSEAMTTDGSADPTLTFDPAVGSTLSGASGSWNGTTDTYTVTYGTVSDANVDEDSVTIDVTGAKDAAGNGQVDYAPEHEFAIDTANPQATVTTDRTTIAGGTPIFEGSLLLTITVTYDEAMDPATSPTIALENGGAHWGPQTDVGWSAGDTVFTATFTHDGTEEPALPQLAITAFARGADGSGATDLSGNAELGDDSPDFDIDTRRPEVADVGVSRLYVAEDRGGNEDEQIVTVVYDEPMRSDGTADPTITFGAGSWASNDDGAWSVGDTTWTETFTLADHDEEIADVTVDVAGAKDAAGNAQEDYAPQAEFHIDTVKPEVVLITIENYPTRCDGRICIGPSDTFALVVEFTESVDLALASQLDVGLNLLDGNPEKLVPFGSADIDPAFVLPGQVWDNCRYAVAYTVVVPDNACHLDVTSIAVTSGTLRDVAGNDATIVLPPLGQRIGGLLDVTIDTQAPTAVDDPQAGFAYTYINPAHGAAIESKEGAWRVALREDTPIFLDVLSNDTDNCPEGLHISGIPTPPRYGELSVFDDDLLLVGLGCPARVIRYDPAHDYQAGIDEFEVTVRDCGFNTNTTRVDLYVYPKSVLSEWPMTALAGVPTPVTLSVTDEMLLRVTDYGVDAYTFELLDVPQHGVFVEGPGLGVDAVTYDRDVGTATVQLSYVSEAGFTGRERVRWRAIDPYGVSAESVLDLAVTAPSSEAVPLEPAATFEVGSVGQIVVPPTFLGIEHLRIMKLGIVGEVVLVLTLEQVTATVTSSGDDEAIVLTLDTTGLEPGMYLVEIPLGPEAECIVPIEIEEVEE